jgi:hypothetical protein
LMLLLDPFEITTLLDFFDIKQCRALACPICSTRV